ncbi:uncharacterized protein LOC134211977 [Armigeres subalbatus]|uniref:uncharacterized protein LOC134211977 n=1 Tax=Armigeres subalbatus TaxID=124917 RepID=UPI002ED663E4
MLAMMDSNENENYCYQQQHQQHPQPTTKAGGNLSKGAIPKASSTGLKYQNQFNNNNNIAEQENLMPHQGNVSHLQVVGGIDAGGEINGTSNGPESLLHSTTDDTTEKESKESLPNVKREEVENLLINPLDEEEGDLDGDSDNNSLGNLSYISDNGLIEEIILLPNNIYSDDENGSASDDCIYAYRGDDDGAPALLEYREQPADDETDFLEMDFDPEPSSELENLNEHADLDADSVFQPATLPVERISRQDIVRSPLKSPSFERDSPNRRHGDTLDQADGVVVAPMASIEMKKTGAIPKKFSSYSQQSAKDAYDFEMAGPSKPPSRGNSKNLKLDLKLCTEGTGSSDFRYQYPYYDDSEYIADDDDDDESTCCLDCTEKKGLLMQTKQDLSLQKVCRSCFARNLHVHQGSGGTGVHPHLGDYFGNAAQSLNTSTSEADLMSARAEQIVLQALNKVNELKATPPSMGLSKSMEELCVELEAGHRDQEVPDEFSQDLCADNTVTIYTMNCGELTIIEALTRIGVAPNLDVLRQYFTECYSVDTSKMNIPQYLLYMSKRDCNFRKLIEAIKSCCDEPLDVQYYPLDPFSDTPEVVPINSIDIAKRWNANTNLRQIINFKHKHFHTLNVLGKIVNILRQPSRGKHTSQIINIPQYYKSGSITITRIT